MIDFISPYLQMAMKNLPSEQKEMIREKISSANQNDVENWLRQIINNPNTIVPLKHILEHFLECEACQNYLNVILARMKVELEGIKYGGYS